MAEIAETKYGLDGKVTFEQSDGGIKVVDLANLGGAAGAGVTNIGVVSTTTTVSITSDTGNPGVIPAATPALAGIMSAEQASKLDAQPLAPVVSVAGKTGVVALTGADVGLGSVNNTSDTAKPISTATQLALNQKQNTLTVPGDVPGLTTALAGKQATLTTYTEVPGLTVALNAKQATLTGVADVPNLQAALDLKQGRLAAGTNKLLAAPATLGGAPTQVTIGANLAFDGTTLSSTASGGGSTTYAGLTDAASVNLPTVNTPLQTALSNKQPSIPVNAGTVLGSPSVAGGNPTPVSIVNDLTTGGSGSVLAAEMGKTLQSKKAEAVNASGVVASGVTSLTRTAVTTSGAEAPYGYYNRPLLSDHSLTVDLTGAVAGDAIMVLNTHATNAITVTAGSLTLNIPAGKAGEMAYNGTAFVDTTPVPGSVYTDEQAQDAAAAMITSGTHAGITTVYDDAANKLNISANNLFVYKIPAATDISPGTTTEVILFEQVITGLVAFSEIEVTARVLATGAGNKSVRVLIGGTAGVADGTQVAQIASTGFTQRGNAGFIVNSDLTGVVGTSPNIVNYGSTSAVANPVVAVAVGSGIRVKVTAVKSAGADTMTFQGGQVRVFP